MNTKPILFSTEMVQAILSGRKTQTRRTKGLQRVNQDPYIHHLDRIDYEYNFVHFNITDGIFTSCGFSIPYKTGDILWVRESFAKVEFKDQPTLYLYKANPEHQSMKWKPSIHMPKEAARLFLKVINVRVERLKDISKSDAIAEGVYEHHLFGYDCYLCKNKHHIGSASCNDGFFDTAKESFLSLWESINGKESLESNPFVWVIEFERIEKPENF